MKVSSKYSVAWIAALLFLVLLVFAMPSGAATVQEMMSDLSTQLGEEKKLGGELSGFTQDNEKLMKENSVLAGNRIEQNRLLAERTTVAQNEINALRARQQAEIDELIAEFAAKCPPKPLPQAQYDHCMSIMPNYDARVKFLKSNGDAKRQQAAVQYDKDILEPIRNIIGRQTNRIEQIATTMKSNFDKFEEARERQIAVQARIASLRAAIADLCRSARPGSAAYQLCFGFNWDGTRTDLPPLTGPRKGTIVVPNK